MTRVVGTRCPLLYNVHHTSRMAISVCIAPWLLAATLVVPSVVVHVTAADETCDLLHVIADSQYLRWFVHYIPEILAMSSAPLIWFSSKPLKKDVRPEELDIPGLQRQETIKSRQTADAGSTNIPRRKMAVTAFCYTGALLLTWTPIGYAGFYDGTPTVMEGVRLLFELHSVLDPLLICGTQDDIREYVIKLLC